MKEIGPRERKLREQREANFGLRLKPRKPADGPIGDGVAFTSMAMPKGVLEKTVAAIRDGRLSLDKKRGRPKKGEVRNKPWEAAGLSRAQWYRKQAVK